jgi:hypothetical protein
MLGPIEGQEAGLRLDPRPYSHGDRRADLVSRAIVDIEREYSELLLILSWRSTGARLAFV